MRRNYIGHRAKIGVILPSTNTAVEYDLQKLNLRGVTWHPSRFWVESPKLSSNDSFLHFLDLIRAEIPLSVRNVLTANPTHLMIGMSAETFWGGVAGNEEFVQQLREQIGSLGLSTGANACDEALKIFGAQRISVLTPYQEVGDEQVRRYFSEIGYKVQDVIGLKCPSATAIAEVSEDEVIHAVRQLDAECVDAIIQVGTNLSTIDLFPTLEKWLGKPCIPINAATAWHALRNSGVTDQIDGLGSLLERY